MRKIAVIVGLFVLGGGGELLCDLLLDFTCGLDAAVGWLAAAKFPVWFIHFLTVLYRRLGVVAAGIVGGSVVGYFSGTRWSIHAAAVAGGAVFYEIITGVFYSIDPAYVNFSTVAIESLHTLGRCILQAAVIMSSAWLANRRRRQKLNNENLCGFPLNIDDSDRQA